MGAEKESDQIIFETVSGRKFSLSHTQDCCEKCYLEEVVGDINDLILNRINLAEISETDEDEESVVYTFYKLHTIAGDVMFRWYSDKNTYYSTKVNFREIKD